MKNIFILLFTFLLMVSCAAHMSYPVTEVTTVPTPTVIVVKKQPVREPFVISHRPYVYRPQIYVISQRRINTHKPPIPRKPYNNHGSMPRINSGPGPIMRR